MLQWDISILYVENIIIVSKIKHANEKIIRASMHVIKELDW